MVAPRQFPGVNFNQRPCRFQYLRRVGAVNFSDKGGARYSKALRHFRPPLDKSRVWCGTSISRALFTAKGRSGAWRFRTCFGGKRFWQPARSLQTGRSSFRWKLPANRPMTRSVNRLAIARRNGTSRTNGIRGRFDGRHLLRVVGEQANSPYSKLEEHCDRWPVLPRVNGQTQGTICADGIMTGVLQSVGAYLVSEADPSTLLSAQVDQDPGARLDDPPQ